MEAEQHVHKRSSWVVVGLITVASIVLGFAFVMQSLALAIVGGVLGLVGVVLGGVTRILEDAY